MIHEQVDDLPVLLAHLERLKVSALLDQHFPAHGNWRGCSLGWLTVVWLTHLLSRGDHRLSHVQSWAAQRLQSLRAATDQDFAELDFTDDRLAVILRRLSRDQAWQAFEDGLNQQLLRVYDLQPECVRLDTTTASSARPVDAEGLFQFGISKDHRPDLPQIKVALATLDPLGLPLVTQILPGQRADDPLYLPLVARVRQGLGRRGLLYVGDCKMASLATRAEIHRGGDYYLCPLPEVQLSPAALEAYLQPVWTGAQALTPIYRTPAVPAPVEASGEPAGSEAPYAEAFEACVSLTIAAEGAAPSALAALSWTERRVVVRDRAQAETQQVGLAQRLVQAQAALAAQNERRRGKPRFASLAARQAAAEKVLQRYQVAGLLRVEFEEQVSEQQVRGYAGRSPELRVTREYAVRVEVDEAAVARTMRLLGWRVYATQAPPERLGLAQAVGTYRNQYRIERGFERLKGQPLSLTPLYLQREDHIIGLVRLLTVALRLLCVVEYQARQRLTGQGKKLAGLYVGNPRRATAQPTAELLLAAFRGIAVIWVGTPGKSEGRLSRFSQQHEELLTLWGFSIQCYQKLCPHSWNPP